MTRILLISMAALMLTSCGVKRPLMKPEDVPAYEDKRMKELRAREADRQDELRRQQMQPTLPR